MLNLFFCNRVKFVIFFFCICLIKGKANNAFPFILSSAKDQIVIEALIENSSVNLLFDTGAPCCLFLQNIADTANYNIIRKTYIIDPYGKKKTAWLTKIEKCKLGFETLNNVYFILLESNAVFNKLKIEGIIGRNIINNFDWKFDFINKQCEFSKKIKLKDLNKYEKLTTFIFNDCLHTIFNVSNSYKLRDTCLIDFGDNLFINSKSAFKSKGNYSYYGIHSTATGADVEKSDTTFILISEKLQFDNGMCLNKFPLFTNSEISKNSIGCRFFTLFDEIIIMNSKSSIFVKSQRDIILNIKKYNDFYGNNLITSFYNYKGENSNLRLGDDLIDKKINMTETINFTINVCQ